MHKHRSKRTRKTSRIANANFELSESAQSSVHGVVNSIDGGEDFAVSYLRQEFTTKYCDESLVPGIERRQAAIAKFLVCEERNRSTNLRFVEIDPEYNILPRISFRSFLRFARRLTRDILGPLNDKVVLGSFSGGASTSRPRTLSSPAHKFVGKVDLTEGVEKFLDILYREAPLLREYKVFTELNFVEGSKLFTVPKKTDIDRCACKEPDINMFLQKGVGRHIRRRLLRHGQNLNDQSINRGYAKRGSKDSSLATLDLSSASDLISIEVVRALLPFEWFEYLNDIRSHNVNIDGNNCRMEMFSSMGNGFTFELESLIFLVLMRTTSYFEGISGIISVYGDDLIIPSGLYESATWILTEFGFSVNPDKSFHEGPFRESCGGHYHHGEDVTPFYLKRKATHLTDLIRVCNQLRLWAFADPSRQYIHRGLYHSWYNLASYVPKELWGGYDYALDTKLVSPPGGSKILVRISDKTNEPEQGKYLAWHNSYWNRTDLAFAKSEPVSTNQICRSRRATSGTPVADDYFWEEVAVR